MKLLTPDSMPPVRLVDSSWAGPSYLQYSYDKDEREVHNLVRNNISYFLGGTIDNGNSKDWQKELIAKCEDIDEILLISPRVEHWNPDASDDVLRTQIIWERIVQKLADFKIYHFEDGRI